MFLIDEEVNLHPLWLGNNIGGGERSFGSCVLLVLVYVPCVCVCVLLRISVCVTIARYG